MLFHSFSTQEERRKFGGSYFIELQYCRLAEGSEREKILSVDIEHWKDDSLYIYGDDDETFVLHYGQIFTDGIYANGKHGMVDICGLNYYAREQTKLIVKRIQERKPLEYQTLLNWLEKSKGYGFYILGL